MNKNKKVAKKHELNMLNRMIRNMNALKDAKYSGTYVVVSFFEQTVILELLNDISCSDLIYAVASTLSIICMLVICSVLQKRAKKQIESRDSFPESESDKWIECATMLGYFSPVLCIVTWLSGFVGNDEILMKWYIIALVIALGIGLPLIGKKKSS